MILLGSSFAALYPSWNCINTSSTILLTEAVSACAPSIKRFLGIDLDLAVYYALPPSWTQKSYAVYQNFVAYEGFTSYNQYSTN
jgi:hypothetical protein